MKILSGLAEGQVLQRLGSRGANLVITGTSAEEGPLHVTIFEGRNPVNRKWNQRLVGKVVRGKFSVKLAEIPVGGPYLFRIETDHHRFDVRQFFVGDVWVLAGQSNMQGVGNMSGKAKPHPMIRAFSMRREWRRAEDPLHILEESPDVCHTPKPCSAQLGEELRRDAIKGVGVGVFFAREMFERSGGVRQGLICVAHGGTSMQQWSPERKNLGGESLYASMLASLKATGQPVAGVLWYQGESETNPADAAVYTPRMKKLVAATRRDFGQPNLPWISVQIGRFCTEQTNPISWNSIQEQQRLLPGKIKFFETVPAIDLPLDDLIHVGAAGFPRLATRLASAADRLVYGHKGEKRGPQWRRIGRIESSPWFTLDVEFDCVQGGLQAAGEPSGFRLVAPSGAPVEAIYKTELRGDVARLHLTGKPAYGTQLFYGHGFCPYCNITDARGFSLPVLGPIPVGRGKPKALLPFLTRWNLTPVVPAAKRLDAVSLAEVKSLAATAKRYPEQGFINEHATWGDKSGHAFFQTSVELSESMQLDFLMGYDGPFRLWLDGKPLFTNMRGTNPCVPDESTKTVALAPGVHEIHVGMDLNDGRAWGFFLRLARKDVTKEQIHSGNYAKPAYL